MTDAHRSVTVDSKSESGRIPEPCSQGALIAQELVASGKMVEVGQRLHIQRQGGYTGLDVFVLLLYFYAANWNVGLKSFYQRIRRDIGKLAGIADRKTLPTPASVSRALAAVDSCPNEFGAWLLFDGAGAQLMMQHDAVLHRDGLGEGWHVFDFDPTKTVMRHRALPTDPELPPARRRAHEAQPGYAGRKRGNVQLCRSTLEHAGSGLWLGIWTAPGNGDFRGHAEKAARTVRDVCLAVGHDPGRALLRADGEAGNTPFITACQEAGIRFLTRSAHYTLFSEPALREHLNRVAWYEVEDSRSGPRRQAAELGWFTLPCAPDTVREDGTPYEPVRARLVVSRFPSETDRGAGHLIDGWKYELFATDLEEAAWPAPEVVTTYYGRTGQENRFAQEDRELGLDRIISYHLPGQHLANLVGLFVWNLQTCRGLPLLDVPNEVHAQLPRQPVLAVPAPPLEVPLMPASVVEVLTPESEVSPTKSPSPARARRNLEETLQALDWSVLLKGRGSWTWDSPMAGLRCPAGSAAPLNAVKLYPSRASGTLRFLAPLPACRTCPVRHVCTDSESPDFRKELAITVPGTIAARARRLLAATRSRRPRWRPRRHPRTECEPKPLPKGLVATWQQPTDLAEPPLAARPAVLSPAVLRKAFRSVCRGVDVYVSLRHVLPAARPHPAVSYTAAERQHRRLTFAQRLSYNALAPDDLVHVQLKADSRQALRKLFPRTARCSKAVPSQAA